VVTTDNKIIGSKIKYYRTKKRITQKELGNLIGKSEITIRKYESGDIQVPNNVLQAIASALDVSVINLMDLSEKEDAIHKDNAFIKYLESIGYTVEIQPEVLEWHYEDVIEDGKVIGKAQIADKETYTVTMIKDKDKITFTEKEFEEFQSTIKNSVDYQVWLKNSKQSK
jgi:transcriptional regulator with XRE-family HTH domain